MFSALKIKLAVLMVPVIAVGGLYFAEPVKADEDVKELNENVMSVNSMEDDDTFETQSFSERRRKGDPNDPDFGKQWFHYMIHDEEAWKKSTGKGVTVAVIDNGFNAEHPDLKANVKGTYDATGNNNIGPV
ncbi:Subtilase family protein, partial [Lachnospiraceae bacterium KH1T2]